MLNRSIFPLFSFVIALVVTPIHAAVVFQQDFSSSATVGDYVSATPNSGQVNDISADGSLSTVNIVGNQLTFSMGSGGTAGMLRSTDLSSPIMSVMDLELVFTYSTASTGTFGPGPNFQVGDYPSSATNYTSGGASNDRFADILWRRTGTTYQIESGGATAAGLAYNTEHTLRFFLNDSGVSHDYLGPDGFQYTLNHHSEALFLDGVLVVNNGTVSPGVANADLSTFRLRAVDLDRTLAINSLTIWDVLPAVPPPPAAPIPEPSGFALLFGVLVICRSLRRRN
jgi:hypothetical protein